MTPLTYETFYGLREPPFAVSPDLKFLYHGAAHDRAAQTMLGAIRRREGIVVLTGEQGVGKTMVCQAVIEQLDQRTLTAVVSKPFGSAEQLLKTLLVDFGVISQTELAAGRLRNASRAELSAALRDFLFSLAPIQAFALVIIHGAHNLPIAMLDEIRVLAEAESDERLLQLVLVGQPGLLATLARPELRQLSQRVTIRCTLGPLTSDEIAGYIMHRLAVAGTSPRVEFADRSIARIYELSRGVPRVVNLLCDRALSAGHDLSASVIDEPLVESAAKDLDLVTPLTKASILRMAGVIVAMLLLAAAGAAAAGFVFRAEVTAVVTDWQRIPSSPPPPSVALPSPLAPIEAPEPPP